MITPAIISRLDILTERYEELAVLLSDAQIITQQELFRQYSQEYSDLEALVLCYQQYRNVSQEQAEAQALLQESDADMRALAEEVLQQSQEQITELTAQLQILLLPKDPSDARNVFLEIRAGAGGDEAAIFAGDLFRMYTRFAEQHRWRIEVISTNAGEHGGYKEIITRVIGQQVYAHLKYESGGHRVQRVPDTESQGRIHTSACTVAIMPEPDEQAAIAIRKEDLRIDTFRSSGAGGQHVNTTDSAIRITHLPSGIVVECQDERSQHKNKAKAMALLAAKLETAQRQAQEAETSSLRKTLVGSGDRSQRIRTYNFPQGRVTDHRINLTLYRLQDVLAGDLAALLQPLRQEEQSQQLAQFNDSPL